MVNFHIQRGSPIDFYYARLASDTSPSGGLLISQLVRSHEIVIEEVSQNASPNIR